MTLRVVLEVDDIRCPDCKQFPNCAVCFEWREEGYRGDAFKNVKLIKVEKVNNGK